MKNRSIVIGLMALLFGIGINFGQVTVQTENVVWEHYNSNWIVGQGNTIGEGAINKSVAVFRLVSETADHKLARFLIDLGTNRSIWSSCIMSLGLYSHETNLLASVELNSFTTTYDDTNYFVTMTVTNNVYLPIGSSNVFSLRANLYPAILDKKLSNYSLSIPANGIRVERVNDGINFFCPDVPIIAPITVVPAQYAKIDDFVILRREGQTNGLICLSGRILPETDYDVQTSTDLVFWETVGTVTMNPPSETVLKEQAVGVIGPRYDNKCFIRLKMVQ